MLVLSHFLARFNRILLLLSLVASFLSFQEIKDEGLEFFTIPFFFGEYAAYNLQLEELAESLCVRFGRELAIASADIWTLIGAADFAFPLLHVTDLLLFLLACCETKSNLLEIVKRR